MTILDSELKFYKSATVDDTPANGGRMSAAEVISGVVQNVFPHVLKAERDSGSTKYRKLFAKVANDADETLLAAQLWLDNPTPADDWCVMWPGSQTDTQGDITGSERIYGCAALSSDAAAGGSTLVVDVEDTSITGIFHDGDTIRVTDMADPSAATGNEEFLTISGAPTVSGTQVTITVAETLANDYTVAAGSRVSSVYGAGDIKCSMTGWTETTAAGAYDEATYPPVLDNIGTIEQTWTLEFTDASNYTVSGDTVGSVGSGSISADFAPQNPDLSKPYFTLEATGFGGTWAQGDKIVFTTHPAAVPIWEKRVVPAGAASLANNKITLVLSGESA